jgi:hypothetical protein
MKLPVFSVFFSGFNFHTPITGKNRLKNWLKMQHKTCCADEQIAML